MVPDISQLSRYLNPGRLRTDISLAPYTTFKIGGPTQLLYETASAEDLADAVGAARKVGIPFVILGLGANILVGDRGFPGLVIRNTMGETRLLDGGQVRADSGVIVADLIELTAGQGLSGLEHYVGIPSTVGGAAWQNLHFLSPAPARERTMFIEEVVESVELLTETGQRRTVSREEMGFGYDTSRLHHTREIALAVTFRLTPANPETLRQVMAENLEWRGTRHPSLITEPSAGSIFKKIEGVGAGRLIDQCGLKGYRVGNAQISPRHANIIVNLGGATAADVRALIAHAQQAVLDRFGQQLEPEIGFIGEF